MDFTITTIFTRHPASQDQPHPKKRALELNAKMLPPDQPQLFSAGIRMQQNKKLEYAIHKYLLCWRKY